MAFVLIAELGAPKSVVTRYIALAKNRGFLSLASVQVKLGIHLIIRVSLPLNAKIKH